MAVKKRYPEKPVECSLVRLYQRMKGVALKFVSPGWRGAMDRLCLSYIPPRDRAMVAKYVKFIECKAPGETLEPHQLRRRVELERLGYTVLMLDVKIPNDIPDISYLIDDGTLK